MPKPTSHNPAKLFFHATLLCCILFTGALSGAENLIDSAASRLDFQRFLFPQEKIHVTTDQARYVAGDSVWLRAWVVDAESHRQVTASRYVYGELISPFGKVERRVKIQQRDSAYYGFIPTEIDLPEGEYTLAAFTMFMENAGPDFFFRKPLGIVSPYASKARLHTSFEKDGNDIDMTLLLTDENDAPLPFQRLTVTTASGDVTQQGRGSGRRHVRVKADDAEYGTVLVRIDNFEKYVSLPRFDGAGIDVTFHPEGGYMIPGVASRIGFKAIDEAGRGVDVEGTVVDSLGNEVARFASLHRGMGEFSLVAMPGQRYTARIGELTFPLPAPRADASVIHADNSRGSTVNVSAEGNLPAGAWLLVQNRGRMLTALPVEPSVQMRLPRHALGEGVVQLLLLDAGGNPLSERLIFNHSSAPTECGLAIEELPDRADSQLAFQLPEGTKADVAVALLSPTMAEPDTLSSIPAQLLLQSDIAGSIEDPAYYFRKRTPHTDKALEALMLTQGWTRYDVPASIRADYENPMRPIEIGAEITGTIKSRWHGKPIDDAEINVMAPKAGFANYAVTDTAGRFAIKGVDFPEGTTFIAQALNAKGKNEHNFVFNSQQFMPVEPLATAPGELTGLKPDYSIDYAYRINRLNGAMSVTLGEVTVTAGWKQNADFSELIAAETIDTGTLDDRTNTYEEALRAIPGVTIEDGAVRFHNRPVDIWVDGSPWGSAGTGSSFANSPRGSQSRELGVDMPYGNPFPNSTNYHRAKRARAAKRILNHIDATENGYSPVNLLTEFEAHYPFEAIKRIDFVMPTQAAALTGNASMRKALIVFTTKNPDEYTGHLPWYIKTVTPLGYQRHKEHYVPRYSPTAVAVAPTNGTLLWIPKLHIEHGTTLTVPSGAKIVVEGLTYEGTPITLQM